MAFAVRAEHGWYLADAMFIYELLTSLVEGEEKAALLGRSSFVWLRF